MIDPTLITLASVGIAGFGIVIAAALRGWREWLDVRRLEIENGRHPRSPAGARIELASLRERVRRLEAIASGADPRP